LIRRKASAKVTNAAAAVTKERWGGTSAQIRRYAAMPCARPPIFNA